MPVLAAVCPRRLAQLVADVGRELVDAADDLEADVVAQQRVQLESAGSASAASSASRLRCAAASSSRPRRRRASGPGCRAGPRSRRPRAPASMPARCPSTRGRWRCAAQRPLPSMMTAMCRAAARSSTCRASASSGSREDDGKEVFERHRSQGLESLYYLTDPFGGGLGTVAAARTAAARNRPVAAAVRPAARSIATPESATPSPATAPRPISTSVPAMLRTMWRRKPSPSISITSGSPRRSAADLAGDRCVRSVVRPSCRCPGMPRSRACRRAARRGLAHRLEVERVRHVPDVAAHERRDERRVDDAVFVGLAGRAEPGVEPWRRISSTLGDTSTGSTAFSAARRSRRDRQRETLATWPRRMHAGVGAPGAVHGDRRALESASARLRAAPGSRRPWLPLPADVVGAVVGSRVSACDHWTENLPVVLPSLASSKGIESSHDNGLA